MSVRQLECQEMMVENRSERLYIVLQVMTRILGFIYSEMGSYCNFRRGVKLYYLVISWIIVVILIRIDCLQVKIEVMRLECYCYEIFCCCFFIIRDNFGNFYFWIIFFFLFMLVFKEVLEFGLGFKFCIFFIMLYRFLLLLLIKREKMMV